MENNKNLIEPDIRYSMSLGMRYGDMPKDHLARKYESTSDLDDGEGEYDSYLRNEIRDWSPDDALFASEEPRVHPGERGGIINNRYYGGRGTENEPSHPEMFLELTENEPRGIAVDPDFNKFREQSLARTRFKRFGAENDAFISEGRWAPGKANYYARYLTHLAAKPRAMIFMTSKDGRRTGLRRDYQYMQPNVNLVQEDLQQFRPDKQTFTDYITDYALNPDRKAMALSDTILKNNKVMYNQSTTDHEFAIASYSQGHRGRFSLLNLPEDPTLRAQVVHGSTYGDADIQPTRKTAGLLMGDIVKQKQSGESQQESYVSNDAMVQKGKKQSDDPTALLRHILAVMPDDQTTITTIGKSRKKSGDDNQKTAMASRPTQQTSPELIDLMYKAVTPGTAIKNRRQGVNDITNSALNYVETLSSKAPVKQAATGKRNSVMVVNGKHLKTPTYRQTKKTIGRNVDVNKNIQGFGDIEKLTLLQKTPTTNYRITTQNDTIADTDRQFHGNYYSERSGVAKMGDKSRVRAHINDMNYLDNVSASIN